MRSDTAFWACLILSAVWASGEDSLMASFLSLLWLVGAVVVYVGDIRHARSESRTKP